jgi:hypothetical protein
MVMWICGVLLELSQEVVLEGTNEAEERGTICLLQNTSKYLTDFPP